MERFYSSLDLREIKVGPDSSFPPDSDGAAPAAEGEAAPEAHSAAPGDPQPTGGGHEVLKVSAKSRPSAVAGAIAGVVRETRRAEVQAIGAGATNQAVKAIAIARDYLAEDEIDMICIPEFIDVIIENEERTAIRFIVEPR
jgi:stage V sporulation protein S